MESLTMLSRKVIPLFSLTAFSCLVAGAQVSNGTVVGTITETSGAVASKARVTVRNIETGMERNVTTDASGDYDVPNLVAGHYSITVTHSDFSTATVRDFALLVAQRPSINTLLRVRATSEKVLVMSSSVQLLYLCRAA
jgi:Carboxypeptidase regulatory-like domain/Protein of unknown function (DUF1501)